MQTKNSLQNSQLVSGKDQKDQDNLEELVQYLRSVKNDQEMLEFLEGILTPKELSEIPQRLQIVKKLKGGIPQRKIADELGVGIATVTRGSRELKRGMFSKV